LFVISSEADSPTAQPVAASDSTLEPHAMSGSPMRKEELIVLESFGRGQPAGIPDETILERLGKLGLLAKRGEKWSITERGKMDLTRRKSLKRSSSKG
jgi:hypothetical protein